MTPKVPAGATVPNHPGPYSLSSHVYALLRASIIVGEIPPQTHINIDATARELGASQTPVREALQRLEGDGLVTSVPHRGYETTAMLTANELRNLFEFRLLIEPWAARRAAADPLTNPAAALASELQEFERTCSTGEDLTPALLQHDVRFHQLILRATTNTVVSDAYDQTHCHLHLFRLYRPGIDASVTLEEHRLIWQALDKSDTGAAARAMHDHVASSYRRYTNVHPGVANELRLIDD